MGSVFRCLVFVTSIMLGSSGWAQQPRFERIVADNIPQPPNFIGAVNAVAQDDVGFMWFGGDNGVVRYDGHEFKLYAENRGNPRGLLGHFVHAIVVDKTGVLWIATGQGLNRYNPGTDDFDHWRWTPKDGTNLRQLNGFDARALVVDTHNNLWVATENGLTVLAPKREDAQHYVLPQDESAQDARGQAQQEQEGAQQEAKKDQQGPKKARQKSAINSLHLTSTGQLWLGLNGGIQIFDLQQRRFLPPIPAHEALSGANIRAIAADYLGHLWLASFAHGIFELSATGELLRHHLHDPNDPSSLPENSIWGLLVDHQFDIWVATNRHGLARWERGAQGFARYRHQLTLASSLNSDQIRALFEDELGDIWVGSAPGGIDYYNRGGDIFSHYQVGLTADTLSDNSVISVKPEHSGKLWVGTELGLNLFDPQNDSFKRYLHDPVDSQSLCQNAVLTVEEDGPGALWVGTWGGGLCRLDRSTGKFKRYNPASDAPGALGSAYIWQLYRDRDGRLWVATEDRGLYLYRPETDDFENFQADPGNPTTPSSNFVVPLLQDKNGDLWFGTLKGVNRMKRNSQRISRLEKELPELVGQRILALLEDDLGRIWIGTEAMGIVVYNPADGSRKALGVAQGLPSLRITSFVSDRDSNIWAGSMDGLVKIEPHHFWVSTLKRQQGLLGNNFNRNAAFCTAENLCYFGSSQGLTRFNPNNLARERQPPKVVFTNVLVDQKSVWNRESEYVTSKVRWQGNQLELGYDHTSLEFVFAALSYRGSAYNAYSYRLHGFDTEWVDIGVKNSASYTRLASGNYTFEVRGANNHGDWNLIGPSIPIQVAPPPWWSWPAVLFYLVLCIGLIGAGAVLIRRHMRLSKSADRWQEAFEQERLKGQYYVQAANTLGDPLLAITGLVQGPRDGIYGPVAPPMQDPLDNINNHSRRLTTQVSNIVDFAQMTTKTLMLRPKPVLLNALVDEVFALLRPLTQDKPLNLINGLREDIEVVADPHCLRHILFNLVNNAIKYTQEGYVMVMASKQGGAVLGYANIIVEDTGIGIAAHRQQAIFQAFTKLQNEDQGVTGGIGLSLAVTQAMVKLLGGHLQVDSKLQVGSRFTFSLLLAQATAATTQVKRAGAVVVVDDDTLGRLLLVSHLTKIGVTVQEIESAGVAREQLLASAAQVSMLLLNTQMKGLNCYELVHRLREHSSGRTLPVVVMSPNAAPKSASDPRQDPYLILLTQPVAAEQLQRLCEQFVQTPVRAEQDFAKVGNFGPHTV